MNNSFEKAVALLGSGLLALTLSACQAPDDTSPAPEETEQEQFDTFEDESAPPTDDVIQEEQSATPQDGDHGSHGNGTPLNEETQSPEDDEVLDQQ